MMTIQKILERNYEVSGGFFKLSSIASMIAAGMTSSVLRGLNPIPAPAVYVTLMVLPSGLTYSYDPVTMSFEMSRISSLMIEFDVLNYSNNKIKFLVISFQAQSSFFAYFVVISGVCEVFSNLFAAVNEGSFTVCFSRDGCDGESQNNQELELRNFS